jgi:hypothetical protein
VTVPADARHAEPGAPDRGRAADPAHQDPSSAGGRYLAVIERGYRGSVEVQFCDLGYLARGLHGLLGGLDVALRGSAVTFAVSEPCAPPLRIAGRPLDTLPDQRRSVRGLLADGAAVYVDEPDLHGLGLSAGRLLPGVVCLDTSALAARWPDYLGVWFL